MGKLTISTGPFSIAMLNYQRVWVKILGQIADGYAYQILTHTQTEFI